MWYGNGVFGRGVVAGGGDWVEACVVEILTGPDVRAPGFAVVQAVALAVGLPVSPPLEAAVRRALSALKHRGVIVQTGRDWMLAAAYAQQQQQQRKAGARKAQSQRRGSDGSRRTSDEHRDADAYKLGGRRESPPPKPGPAPVTPEIKRLAGVLGMLGSEHEGEVLSAARRAEMIRQKLGKDWIAILTQSGR
jgi:hypothetical protein